MRDESMARISRAEHDAWRELCQFLQEIKAVTKEDLESPTHKNETQGQRLFNVIRRWGEAHGNLVLAKARDAIDGVLP